MTSTHLSEEWKPVPVPGFEENYEVSNLGRVRRSATFRGKNWRGRKPISEFLRPSFDKRGYSHLILYSPEGKTGAVVHRLVAAAFVPGEADGLTVCHNDGNPRNNCASNLRWDTHAENNKDKLRHGTQLLGERHQGAKLTANDVLEIRGLYSKGGVTMLEISKRYGISRRNAGMVISRKTWQHLP